MTSEGSLLVMAFTVTVPASMIQKYVNAFYERELKKGIGNSKKIKEKKKRTKNR